MIHEIMGQFCISDGLEPGKVGETPPEMSRDFLGVIWKRKMPAYVVNLNACPNILEGRDVAISNNWRKTNKIEYVFPRSDNFPEARGKSGSRTILHHHIPASKVRLSTCNSTHLRSEPDKFRALRLGYHVSTKFIRVQRDG